MCRTSWLAPSTTTLYGSVESGGIVWSANNVLSAPGNVQSTAEYLFVYQGQPSPTAASSSNTTPISAASSSSLPSSPPAHAALGPTAIAVICLGTILAVGITAAAIFFFRRKAARRRLRQQQGQAPGLWWDPITKTAMQDKPELHGQSRRVFELHSQQQKHAGVVELPVERVYKPVELGTES
jgi:hypothetical protein